MTNNTTTHTTTTDAPTPPTQPTPPTPPTTPSSPSPSSSSSSAAADESTPWPPWANEPPSSPSSPPFSPSAPLAQLTPSDVVRVLKAHMADFQACAVHVEQPTVVEVMFDIEPSGRVSHAKTNQAPGALATCAVAAIGQLSFLATRARAAQR